MGASVVIVGVLATLVIAGQVVSSVRGCGSVDPTDPANYSRITLVNDRPSDVVVSECQGAYCTLSQPVRLGPGQRYVGEAACGTSGADVTSWKVSTDGGMVLGYIAVDSPRSDNSLIFRVSNATATRGSPTRAG